MDNENTQSLEPHTQLNAAPIGTRFREARERANLSIEDVAVHLRLTCQLVQDIENDDYTRARRHLVFLRGYLRAYAKLVDLPADEIIDGFNSMRIEDIPIHKPSWQTEEAREIERAERSNWVAFMVLSTLLVLGVLGWWYAQHYGFNSISNYISGSANTFSSSHRTAAKKVAEPVAQQQAEVAKAEVQEVVRETAEATVPAPEAVQEQAEAKIEVTAEPEAPVVAAQQAENTVVEYKSIEPKVIETKEAAGHAEIVEVKPAESKEVVKKVVISSKPIVKAEAKPKIKLSAKSTHQRHAKAKRLKHKEVAMSRITTVKKKKNRIAPKQANQKIVSKAQPEDKGEWLANQLSHLADETMSTPAAPKSSKKL